MARARIMKPTNKQKQFIDAYLADPDMNASKAYLATYAKVKNLKVAAVNASRLMAKPHVQEYLRQRMRDRERRTEITQDKVLAEIAKVAFVDIKKYLAYRTARTQVAVDEEGEPVIGYAPIIDLADSDDVDGSVIQQVSLSDKGTFSFKLQDKLKALELLGRHMGIFDDKMRLSGELIHTNPNPFSGLSTEELRQLIKDD